MKPSEIQRIAKKELRTELISYIDKSKGADHKVYILNTKKGKFVLRVPKNPWKAELQSWAMREWKKKGAKVPKQIVARKTYCIEECIEGQDMIDAKLSFQDKKKIVHNIGEELKKMHRVKTKGYGFFKRIGVGGSKTWKEFVHRNFFVPLEYFEKNKKFSKTVIQDLKQTFKKQNLEFDDPRLLHFDVSYANVMVKNRKFAAIIDAGDVTSGDPLFEVGGFHRFLRPRRLARFFLEGYGVEDSKSLHFYALTNAMWWCYYFNAIKPGNHQWIVDMERRNVIHYLKKLK